MLVRDRMTQHPLTITPATTFEQTLRLMRERQVRRFPVVEPPGGMVGIVSEKDLLNAAPSSATTLDRFELPALVQRLPVAQVMTRAVRWVPPDAPLETAARLMADHKIGGLPVVDGSALVGIITETDIFRAMVDLLGARISGLRITIRVQDRRGALVQLMSEVTRQGGNIITVSVAHYDDRTHPVVVIKAEAVDQTRLIAALQSWGADVLDVREV